MRPSFLLVLVAGISVLLSSCDPKSGNNSSGAPAAAVGTGVYGQLQIDSASCFSDRANISIRSVQNPYQIIQAQSVINNGTYSFQVPANANAVYTLYAESAAGTGQNSPCYTSGNVPSPYKATICLGSNCQSNNPNSTGNKIIRYDASQRKMIGNSAFACQWGTYGCVKSPITENSKLQLAVSSVQFNSADSSKVQIERGGDLKILNESPFSQNNSWTALLNSKSELEIDSVKYTEISTSGLFRDDGMQWTQATCGSPETVFAEMKQVLRAQGFSDRSVASFDSQKRRILPPLDDVCAYPQTDVSKLQNWKIGQNLNGNQLWFVITPSHAIAGKMKLDRSIASIKKKPKKGIASFKVGGKATRNVAQENSGITYQEWGIAFLVQQ